MMEKIHIIDLKFQEAKEAIASFLIETSIGPILIETGPESTFEHLKAGVEKIGYQIQDINHVLLTHIHFDHGGAAWKFAECGASIYVHPVGLPHLAAPEKLWNSARQIYGDDMDRLWGKMNPIAESQLQAVAHEQNLAFGGTIIKALHTPGHASHHIAWKLGNHIFTGDVAGVKIENGPVVPPCPPPDINITAWKTSLAIIKAAKPQSIYLTHFGVVNDINGHLDSLSYILDDWANWIKPYYQEQKEQKEVIPLFMEYTQNQLECKGCGDDLIKIYEYANPSWMSVAGLYRYWKMKEQGRL
jgi:glyoxylase-like metal-dependent hydrolase (beta-lactamase superfamily II)